MLRAADSRLGSRLRFCRKKLQGVFSLPRPVCPLLFFSPVPKEIKHKINSSSNYKKELSLRSWGGAPRFCTILSLSQHFCAKNAVKMIICVRSAVYFFPGSVYYCPSLRERERETSSVLLHNHQLAESDSDPLPTCANCACYSDLPWIMQHFGNLSESAGLLCQFPASLSKLFCLSRSTFLYLKKKKKHNSIEK